MLQLDTRVGNIPQLMYVHQPEPLMFIPDEIRKIVVFIAAPTVEGEPRPAGTAFYVSKTIPELPGFQFQYLVTAAHNLDIIEQKYGCNEVAVRINFKDRARWAKFPISEWIRHHDKEVDIAAMPAPHRFDIEADIKSFPAGAFAMPDLRDREKIGLGDETFMVGLFRLHYGKDRNLPVVRTGNICAMPEEKVRTKRGMADAFLVESRSIGGLSGSPLFVHKGSMKIHEKKIFVANKGSVFYLLGVMHGHYRDTVMDSDWLADDNEDQKLNMGVAVVTPVEKIMDIIDSPERKKLERKHIDEALESQLPDEDFASPPPQLSKEAFESTLRKVSRKKKS